MCIDPSAASLMLSLFLFLRLSTSFVSPIIFHSPGSDITTTGQLSTGRVQPLLSTKKTN